MIKCTVCRGRVRPPSRPWQEVTGGVHFYNTDTPMPVYIKELGRLAKTVPFVHEACAEDAEPGTLPPVHMVAADLDSRLRQQQRRGKR